MPSPSARSRSPEPGRRPVGAIRPGSLLLGGLLALLSAATCAPADGVERDAWRGRLLDEPVSRPDFVLTDTDGEPYDFRARTEGKVALLFFGYTNCPDVCPVHMANLGAVLDDLSHETTSRIEVVFVTADPERDTPARLREWLDRHHPRFVGLRGSVEEVHALERALGLPPSVVDEHDGDTFVGHAAQILAFGIDGPARLAFPWGTRQADLRVDLPRLARGGIPGGD